MSKVKDDTENQTDAAERRLQGEYVRGVSAARNIVTKAEAGRYHLYLAYNCPWCHRVALARAMLGLQDAISMDVLIPVRTEEGHPQGESKWQFKPEGLTARNGKFVSFPECTADTVNGKDTIVEIYKMSGLEEKSVPMLFDKQTKTVVNNESSEILRMLGEVFSPALGTGPLCSKPLFTEDLRSEIELMNELVYVKINNGAYKAGFSSNQESYEAAYHSYFDALDKLELRLESRTWLCGDGESNQLTEADVRLFPTVFRHDPVYYNRMKLNKRFIYDYPNLWRWMCDFYKLHGVAEASPLSHMKQGYFGRTGNNVVPVGPDGWIEKLADCDYARKRVEALKRLE